MSSDPIPAAIPINCPKCGQKLEVHPGLRPPDRMRIRCSACQNFFVIRRPGSDPQSLPPLTETPTFVGTLRSRPGGTAAPVSLSTGPAGASSTAFQAGDVLAGRYRIVRFLARGGMGEVFEVEDLELKERAALKTIRSEGAGNSLAIERFRREIQLARKVTHPNVCRIFDLSHHRPEGAEPVIFLTMELLPGETLGERLRRGGPLSTEAMLPILRQVVEALAAAHRAGVIHRDLKPGNVILVPGRAGSERAVVTDFGLARTEEADADGAGLTLTATGVVGTPAYIAPEQIEGREITPAVDIYALGVLIYEALTGKLPFTGDTPLATVVRRLQEAPPSPRLHLPDLDPRWEAAILRCLARQPGDRFADVLGVVEALSAPALPPSPVATAAVSPAPPPAAGAPRRRSLLLLLSLLILASFAVAYVRYQDWRRDQLQAEERLGLPEGPVVARRSVAVLGFRDRSGKPDTAWLSAALSEMLSTELGTRGDLRIAAGEDVARGKVELALGEADSLGKETLGRIRNLLGTDYVVLGSYVALDGAEKGRQIRLDLRLQDTAAGETVATVAESGTEAELFQMVNRVGSRLSAKLGSGVPAAAEGSRSALPENPQAARLYSEGLTSLRSFEPAKARDALVQAAALAPDNALVHAALATAWATLGYDGKAREEAKAAYERSRSLPREEHLLVEGRYRETVQDWPRAVEIYRRLWHLHPDNLDHGLRLAAAQTFGGETEAALATTEALRRLPEPLNGDPRIDLAESVAAGSLADFQRQQKSAARAAARGQAQGARLLVAQARLMECRALRNLGRTDAALAACEEGRKLHAEAGDRSGVAEALTHAGNVLFDRGRPAEAKELYERALALHREIGNKGAEAGALNNVAVVLKSQGEIEEARKLYEQVLAICREIGSRGGEAYARNNIGSVLLRRGKLAEARATFEQTLVLWRQLKDRSGEAYALDNLGGALRRQGDLAGALARHEQALALRRQTGQKIGEVASLNQLGSALLDRGELAEARGRFAESLELARRIGNQSATAAALFGVAETEARAGQAAEAGRDHQTALADREKLGEQGSAAESRLALAALALEAGEATKARDLARQAQAEFARQSAPDGEALAASLAALASQALRDGAVARKEMARAEKLVRETEDARVKLIVQLRTAELEIASRRAGRSAMALSTLIGEAERLGFHEIRWQAGLALAGFEQSQGRTAEARARRAEIAAEAREKGYGRLVAQASS